MRYLLLPLLLTGCASDAAYLAYLEAQRAAQTTAYQNARPLVKIVAHEGQQITGLAGIEINLPVESPRVEQQRPSEWAAVVSHAIGVAGVVGGIYASGKAAKDLAVAVGGANAQIASGIQAPQANVSTVTNEANTTTTTTSYTNESESRNSTSTPTTTTNTTTTNTSTTNSNNPVTTNTTTPP